MDVLLNLWMQFNLTVFTNRGTRRVDEVDDIDERWKDYRDGCTPRRDTAYRSVLITLRFVRIVRFNLRKASNLYESKTMRPGGPNNTAICTRRLLRGRRFNLTVSATREASPERLFVERGEISPMSFSLVDPNLFIEFLRTYDFKERRRNVIGFARWRVSC